MADCNDPPVPALAIAGEFNIFTATTVKQRLLDAIAETQAVDIDIDLADVTEIDTAGLQLMVMVKREGASLGKNVHFTGHSEPVVDLIELCDLTGFFGDPILIHSKL